MPITTKATPQDAPALTELMNMASANFGPGSVRKTNGRYLEALAVVDDPATALRQLRTITQRK